MREILFRAKQVNNGEWVEGYFAIGKWYLDEKERYAILPTNLCLYPHCEINEWIEIDPETLCQYTGLTDKNGNRIWENDIVKYMWFGNEEVDIVEYRSTSIGLKENYNAVLTDITEVIGNVFDDKHLLDKTDYRREQEKETEDSYGE